MPSFHGLYHPYIHFQDKGWLKLAALYWDKIFRMVPAAIVPDDDVEVRELADSGIIGSRHPGMGASYIEKPFRNMLATRGADLVRKFGIQPKAAWNNLDHVHLEKLEPNLVDDLVRHELGIVQGDWLGMHPQLTKVYMTALAEVMAPMVGARPVAEDATNHIAVSGLTMEALSDALLGHAEGPNGADLGLEMAMASLAIGYVIPANIASIPANRIIEFHNSYAAERNEFQIEINKIVEGLAYLKDVKNPDDARRHLKNEYEKKLEPKLARLRTAMTNVGWDTFDSATAATFAIPQGLATALAVLGFTLTGGAAAALGIALTGWTIWRKLEKAISDTLKPTAEAFLYQIDRSLKPGLVTTEILNDRQGFLPYL